MKISRHSLISGLSYALDIGGRKNFSHSKNTAYISALISKEMGLDEETTLDIYYAALLHDIGVSGEYIPYEHSEIGAAILQKLPLSEEIPKYVLYHHEFYSGGGSRKLSDSYIPAGARIICLASEFDDAFGKSGGYDIDLHLRIKRWLDENQMKFAEEVVSAFKKLLDREYFLLDYFNQETKHMLSEKSPVKDEKYFGFAEIKRFALCFAEIVNHRSPFTLDHSKGVAKLAKKAAAFLGYDTEIQNKMYIAGLLHDIGQLYVHADILYKKGELTPEERFEVKKHPYYTRKILEQIQGFEDIAEFASNHHERLDGGGYPYHMGAGQLGELDMIMAICDVYQALTEERPYRASLSSEKAWDLIGEMAEEKRFDRALVKKLKYILEDPAKTSGFEVDWEVGDKREKFKHVA